MRKSMVDVMSDLEEQEIKGLQITDKEVEELTQDINFENITRYTLRGIREESKDMINLSIKKRLKKIWIVAAAMFLLGGSAYAAQSLDVFKFIYGDNVQIKTEDKTIINKTQTSSGIKMTINEGLIGDNSGIIMVTFESEDGIVFPKDAAVANLEISNKDINYMVNQEVSEDGLKIVGSFEIDSTNELRGKSITVQADKILDSKSEAVLAKGPWKNTFKLDGENKLLSKDISLELVHNGEKMIAKHIDISTVGVEIKVERLDNNKDKLPEYTPVVKVVGRDDNIIVLKSGSTSEIETGFKWLYNLDTDNTTIFLDKQNIRSLIIDDNIIEIKQ